MSKREYVAIVLAILMGIAASVPVVIGLMAVAAWLTGH